MTKEEAIEYLEKLYMMADITDEYGDMADTEPYETAIDMAVKALKGQQWIPCSERPPEDDVEVFIYLFEKPFPYIAWVTDGQWYTEDFEINKENYPTAWMPLPEPYREEQE